MNTSALHAEKAGSIPASVEILCISYYIALDVTQMLSNIDVPCTSHMHEGFTSEGIVEVHHVLLFPILQFTLDLPITVWCYPLYVKYAKTLFSLF